MLPSLPPPSTSTRVIKKSGVFFLLTFFVILIVGVIVSCVNIAAVLLFSGGKRAREGIVARKPKFRAGWSKQNEKFYQERWNALRQSQRSNITMPERIYDEKKEVKKGETLGNVSMLEATGVSPPNETFR